jgi:DNA-binding SARP family transcriptional activator/tetratricopeptide (TPR) repeat protein
MAPPYYLQCLGVPRLSTREGHEIRIRVRKHLALLVFLAVERQTKHRRERLVDLFWPEVSERAGRQSLATALSVFRNKIGPGVVESDRDYVRLASGHLGLDVDRLESGEVVGDEFTPTLEVAGFLEGFELPGLPEFQLWRDQQHARVLPAIHRGLLVLTDLARRTGDLARMGRHADRLLAINELSEDGIRARMEVAALSGDRITALRLFEVWEGRLQAELGARPSGELERMATRLRRRGWERPVDSKIPTVLTDHWQDRDFVGRAREYRVLYDRWERVRACETGHVAIIGGPGVGKTTLADRFVLAAALEGAITARARCFELERQIPYAAIGMLIEALLDRPGASATDPLALAELARMVSEVGRQFPNLPPVPDTQGETARIRFADAALEFFRALMAEHPLILEVDDFHQADDASLAVIHMAMRRIQDLPLMVVMTSRPEVPDHAATANRIHASAAHLGLQRLDLGPMPMEESAALLDALLARSPAAMTNTQRRALLRAAGGYPLALELLLRNWEKHPEGAAVLSLDAMTVDVARDPEETFRRLAEANLASLPPTTTMVLHVAAILDRRLNDLEMYTLVELSPTQTMAHLAALTVHRTLRDTGGALEFAHPAIRAHAYLAMPASLRRLLHSNVATHLLSRSTQGEGIPGLEIAWHCIRAGRVEEARPYLLSGAREAMHAGAPQEAELALTSGMHLLTEPYIEHAKLLLAEVLQELGRWADSLTTLSDLAGAKDAALCHRADILSSYARHRLELIDATEAGTVFQTLVERICDLSLSPSERVLAASVAGSMCERRRSIPEIESLLASCSQLLDEELSDADEALFHLTLGRLLAYTRKPNESLEYLHSAQLAAGRANMRDGTLARIHLGFSAVLIGLGDYGRALDHGRRAYDLASRIDNTSMVGSASANVALCLGRLGDYAAQKSFTIQVLSSKRASYEVETTLSNLAQLAFGASMTGEASVAREAVDRLQSLAATVEQPWMRQKAQLSAADALLVLGEERAALRVARNALLEARNELTTSSLAGSYSRWSSILAITDGQHQDTGSRLSDISAWRFELDAIDRIELILALCRLGNATGELIVEGQELLEKMPEAVVNQMCLLRPEAERNRPLLP